MVIDTTPKAAQRGTRPTRRALVVEDDDSLGARFKRIIEGLGVPVDVANTRTQAIEQLQLHQYAVALIDIMLCDDPTDRGGIDVVERLTALRSGTAIIVVSASNDVRVPIQAWKHGAFRYLVKKDIRSSEDLREPIRDALRAGGRSSSNAENGRSSSAEGFSRRVATDPGHGRIRDRFERLALAWEQEAKLMASPVEMAMLPAYQEIVGMGPAAVPLILKRLESNPDHWFWALRAITGTNPVRPEDAGTVDAMARAWIEWGREQGLNDE